MSDSKLRAWYAETIQKIIELLDLRSSPSKAMVGYEVILTCFFVAVIAMFLVHDLITIFFPPRGAHSIEALIISAIVMVVSLLAIYGRERLGPNRQ